jgi:hypothetical protein
MATGILGQSAPTAATNTTVYTVPVGKTATFNISVANTTTGTIAARVALAGSGAPASSEFIEYDTPIVGNGVLERGGIVAQAGENVVVYNAMAGLSFTVYGYEE